MRAFLLLIVACSRPEPVVALPDMVSAVVRLQRGDYASVVIELGKPRAPPIVRVAPGITVVGPGWIGKAELLPRTQPSGAEGHSVRWINLVAGDEWETPALADPAVLAVDPSGLHVRTSEGIGRLDGSGWLPVSDATAWPGGKPLRAGPGNGFRLRVNEGVLDLALPGMARGTWRPILQGVDALLCTWWLTTSALPAWQRARIEDGFKAMGVLVAENRAALVDGDMREWSDSHALPIETRAHVLTGGGGWDGPRDGSFGVAARVAQATIFLAVRIRDDNLVPEEDTLIVLLGERRIEIPIPSERASVEGEGWKAAFTEPRAVGTGVEISFAAGELRPDRLVLPVVVQFVDVDPGQSTTTLGSAAHPSLVGVGYAQQPQGL